MRSESIERLFDQLLVSDTRRAGRESLKPCCTLAIISEQAVNIGAEHAAVGRHCSFGRAVIEPRKGPRASGASRDAHVHLVATKRRPIAGRAAHRLEPFLIGEYGLDFKQAESGEASRRAFDALWIGNRASKHLITAAEAEYHATAPAVRSDVNVELRRAQRMQIADCRLRAR